MSSQGHLSILAALAVGFVIVFGLVGYAFYRDNNDLAALSQQNAQLGQSVANINGQLAFLEQRTVQTVTLTNTVISAETLTSTSTQVSYVTDTVTSTATTTSDIYPPSGSTYQLTYVTGNATQTQAGIQCGYFVLAVDITYEMHQQVSSNVVQWAKFPSGLLMQPATQKVFPNQAYVTIDSTYSYGSGFCPNSGSISSVTIFVTDTNNNQLSPSTYFIVQNQ